MRGDLARRARQRDLPERAPRKIDGAVPPHDLVAERAVLCASLEDAGAAEIAAAALTPADFYDITNGRVFEAICAAVKEHKAPDIVSAAVWLKDREWPKPDGGWPAYLVGLSTAAPGAVLYAGRWSGIVSTKARRRRLLATCHRLLAEGYFDVGDEQAWLEQAETSVGECASRPGQVGGAPLRDALKVAFEQITAAAARGDRIIGVPTGYDRLDSKTAGLGDGDLVIVAARPGMGKTSFVLNIATNVASARTVTLPATAERAAVERVEPGFGVCVFSLEMPKEQLATRMSCSEGKVDLGRLRQGHLHADDWRRLTESASYLSMLPVWIDDSSSLSVLDIRAAVRRRQAEFNRDATDTEPARRVGLVAVDYLQLMRGDGDSREQEIAGISRGLKALARDLRVPVIALSQLNRSVETRSTKDKRPQLSDLRESGAIEQDADTIIFIYRDDYYNEDSQLRGIAELIIAKQRNGPTGKVKVRFDASCTRFDNLEPGDYPESDDE